MDSRMNKYQEANSNLSRVSKNKELYQEINNSELDNFTVRSNATVIGAQEQEIDIEKIKKILDTKYNETPKRKSIRIEEEEPVSQVMSESSTKEYDLNSFLAKARDDKEESYEEARAKRLRDTQFDILNNLSLPKEEKEEINDSDPDLIELINTITINEVSKEKTIEEKEEISPLDIFEDLKGNENTDVFDGIKEEIEKIEKTSKVLEKTKSNLDESFYTTSNLFKKKDFEDDSFIEDSKMGVGVKILIALLIISFLVGLLLFLKSFFNF